MQSWDTAIKDTPNCDFSVCTTWGWRDRWNLLDVFRARLDFPDLKAAALTLKRTWRPDLVIVEDSSNGTALVHQLRREGDAEFWPKKVKGSKFERFIAQTDILQSNRVVFPTKAPWFEALKKELFVFPNTLGKAPAAPALQDPGISADQTADAGLDWARRAS